MRDAAVAADSICFYAAALLHLTQCGVCAPDIYIYIYLYLSLCIPRLTQRQGVGIFRESAQVDKRDALLQ